MLWQQRLQQKQAGKALPEMEGAISRAVRKVGSQADNIAAVDAPLPAALQAAAKRAPRSAGSQLIPDEHLGLRRVKGGGDAMAIAHSMTAAAARSVPHGQGQGKKRRKDKRDAGLVVRGPPCICFPSHVRLKCGASGGSCLLGMRVLGPRPKLCQGCSCGMQVGNAAALQAQALAAYDAAAAC